MSRWEIAILRPKVVRCVHYSWTPKPKHLKPICYILVSIRCSQAFRMHKGNIGGICSSFPRDFPLLILASSLTLGSDRTF